VGGDDVPSVAQDEQVAGLRLGDEIRVDPGVRAGDEQRVRFLPLGQLLEQILQRSETVLLELMDALDQALHEIAPRTRLSPRDLRLIWISTSQSTPDGSLISFDA